MGEFKVESQDTIIVNGLQMKEFHENEYVVEVRMSSDELVCFYEEIAAIAYTRNFGNNPFEWAAFAEFRIDDEEYFISAPKYVNGDTNWYSYPTGDDNKRPLSITVNKNE